MFRRRISLMDDRQNVFNEVIPLHEVGSLPVVVPANPSPSALPVVEERWWEKWARLALYILVALAVVGTIHQVVKLFRDDPPQPIPTSVDRPRPDRSSPIEPKHVYTKPANGDNIGVFFSDSVKLPCTDSLRGFMLDEEWVCAKDAAGKWDWREVATGELEKLK